ncbi:hypothetical protein GEU84_007935 [Fertoebacter nigrum]|uniref:von Hippel-Lindau disease tumour suppressor beta domain-containing protein n=1 Tax=Fertoeibacter niger TaxID=2656921 RepID=A0A8X8H145_9RHOB|nr:hypothetical protein [Fertoeibacter niger]
MLAGTAAAAQDFDIQPYAANVRGWQVDVLSDDQGFLACSGISPQQAHGFLGVMQTRDGWMLRVPSDRSESWDGAVVTIDGRVIDSQVEFQPEGAGHIGISEAAVGWIAQGSRLKVAMNGDQTTDWRLDGSAAMVGKVRECFARKAGRPTVAITAPAPVVESDALRPGAGCPRMCSVVSTSNDTPATVQFYNASDVAITLYWLDFTGLPVEYAGLLPRDDFTVNTWAEHRWLARDFQGVCHGGVITPAGGAQVWEIY